MQISLIRQIHENKVPPKFRHLQCVMCMYFFTFRRYSHIVFTSYQLGCTCSRPRTTVLSTPDNAKVSASTN